MTVNYTKITVGGQKIFDASLFFDTLSHRPEWADRINTLECPIGCEPGRGWFLMSRAQFDLLQINSKVDIVWSFGVVNGGAPTSLTFADYVITQAWEAVAADNSPMIVEVADPRQIYVHSATAKRYNVRRAIGDLFDPNSLNGGAVWTWAQMVTNLAGEIQDATGTGFTLVNAPAGTPENMLFDGVSAWHGLCEIAELTNHAVSYDPIAGAAESHELGVAQAGVQADIAAFAHYRDLNVGSAVFGNVPENVRVFFHWRPGEGDNWNPREPYYIDVATGIANASPGFAAAWSPMMAEPNLLSAGAGPINLPELTAEATSIGASRKDEFDRRSQPDVYRFSGLRDFRPGSEIASVKWINDGGETWTEIRMANNDQKRKRFPKYNEPFSASGYVIKPPSGGIPARSGDTPGSANCDIYHRDPTTGDLAIVNDTDGNPAKTKVYNLTEKKSGTDYLPSIRDWQSQWWAILSSSGDFSAVVFEITEAVVEYDGTDGDACEDKPSGKPTSMTASILHYPCGETSVPGQDGDGKISLTDPIGWTEERTSDELVGSRGVAIYVAGEYECEWAIASIDLFREIMVVRDVIKEEENIRVKFWKIKTWDHCELPDYLIPLTDC